LVRLEADGLVTSRPHFGATVAPISLADVEDVYASRRVLESMLADAGAQHADEMDHTDLQGLLEEQQQALAEGDNPRFLELDRKFHQTIYRSSGFVRSLELVDRLRDLSDRYIGLFLGNVDRANVALDEHQRILDACRLGNGQAAAQATEEHVARGLEVLREILSDHDDSA
jgi:DNA-binding GntR family transcriptional regulator